MEPVQQAQFYRQPVQPEHFECLSALPVLMCCMKNTFLHTNSACCFWQGSLAAPSAVDVLLNESSWHNLHTNWLPAHLPSASQFMFIANASTHIWLQPFARGFSRQPGVHLRSMLSVQMWRMVSHCIWSRGLWPRLSRQLLNQHLGPSNPMLRATRLLASNLVSRPSMRSRSNTKVPVRRMLKAYGISY